MVREFYADRDYDASGSIVFTPAHSRWTRTRSPPRCARACVDGKVRTVDGQDIAIDFDSVCITAIRRARWRWCATRAALDGAGIHVAPPSVTGP